MQYSMQMTFCRAEKMEKCARPECGKTVYPMEKLQCLDKVWHKLCFRCTSCGMALNMKNYKGYNKQPYCEPHYPKTVATVVSDTPEMKRVADNTRYQSQHKYHEEYEKMKGTKIDVLNDPEIARHQQNSKMQSNVAYHGELERKQKQESVRPKEDPNAQSIPASDEDGHEQVEVVRTAATSQPLSPRPCIDLSEVTDNLYQFRLANTNYDCIANKENFATTVWSSESHKINGAEPVKVGSIADFDPVNGQHGSIGGTQQPEKNDTHATTKTAGDTETKTGNKKIKKKAAGFSVKANYDYTASDTDEISFKEGDIIVNCSQVDEGWLTGTHKVTLETGMLPANYVQKIVEKTGQARLS